MGRRLYCCCLKLYLLSFSRAPIQQALSNAILKHFSLRMVWDAVSVSRVTQSQLSGSTKVCGKGPARKMAA